MEYSETGFASPTIKLEAEKTNGRTTVNGKGNHLELSPCHERSESDCSAISSSSEAKVKHARFNIEKVASPTQPNDNIGHNQTTLHDTIGYATHEAVPLTMFYRNEASQPGKSKQRPTLAELHKGFDELDEEVSRFHTFLLLFKFYLLFGLWSGFESRSLFIRVMLSNH